MSQWTVLGFGAVMVSGVMLTCVYHHTFPAAWWWYGGLAASTVFTMASVFIW